MGTVFCRCGKKLGGLAAVQENNAQVTIEKDCQIIQSLVQLRIIEQVRRGQRHGTSEDQICWAMMRDHFRRCTKKRVAGATTKESSFFERFVDRWEKRRSIQESNFHQRTYKEELQSWDARMRVGLGDHAEFQQSLQFREQIHSRRLKIQQSATFATPLKHDPEYHLAVRSVREREQTQRITGGNTMQEQQQPHPPSSSS